MMKVFFLLLFLYLVWANLSVLSTGIEPIVENRKMEFLADLVTSNVKGKAWMNIIIFGHFPNILYQKLKLLPFTFITSNTDEDDYYVEDAVPYHTNTILMNTVDFSNFEESLLQIMSMPYWHPHAKIYLYYHAKESKENIARIFYIFWYYRACNVVLIQDDDKQDLLFISQFSPYVSDAYDFAEKYGCWTARKIGIPVYTFEEGFICEQDCHNVTNDSKVRAANFGACVGYVTHTISYTDYNTIQNLDLFPDKGKNFHGFSFRSFTTEVLPFMTVKEQLDGTFELGARDGSIWNHMAKLLNFTMDLTPSKKVIKHFDFDTSIQQVFTVAHRKGDLFLTPIYQFDVIVLELDYTFAYKDSGVCFMSHRAGFETNLFNRNTVMKNSDIFMRFTVSFFCIWFIFCLYGSTETNIINLDFIGKNFMNSLRSVLLINLLHPPKRTSFRIFLIIIIWSYFVINFSMQATVTSLFTASKRGHDVETFEDIVEKGYKINGMSSPDVFLPDTEEIFRTINSRLSPIKDMFECIKQLSNDSHIFCLIDCSVGRYLERNRLNENGEQYLHIAKDRIHSHYLNFVFPKHSVISDNFNKYLMAFFEAGLIKKWEDYRFNNIKEEAPVQPLAMKDIGSVFYLCLCYLSITVIVFLFELFIANFSKIMLCMKLKTKKLTLRHQVK